LAAVLSQNVVSAGVPTSVVSSTIKATTLFATGQAVATGAISAKVAALTEGVMKTMFLTKLKIATAVMLIAGILGGGWFASLALSEAPVGVKPADAKKGAAPGPAPKAEKAPKEILEKAAGAADDVKDDAQKAFVLMTIATAQAKVGDQPAARKSFQQAVQAAEAIQDNLYRKGTTLMFIAEAQAGAGEVEAALKTAEGIQTEGINCKEWALAHIASAQAKAKNVEGALKTIESIPDSGKSLALMLVASCLAGAGDFKQALTLVREMQDESYKVEALTKIAEAQFLAGERDAAKNVIDSARKIADGMEDSKPDVNTSRKASAQMLVALAQIASGDEKAGLKRAGDFKGSRHRDVIWADVAIRRAKAGKVKEASQALGDIQDGVQKAAVLRAVAAAQARAGDFKASRKTTDAIEFVREKAEALLDMAAVRLATGDQAAAADLYREAIQALKTLDILWYDGGPMCATPSHLHRIVSAWAEARDAKSALAWAEKQQSVFVKAIALAGIAEGIGKRLDQEKRPADKK
jgi:tetratricopeptide (TPR) repeat protein